MEAAEKNVFFGQSSQKVSFWKHFGNSNRFLALNLGGWYVLCGIRLHAIYFLHYEVILKIISEVLL
jgi:uncharacterized membrane protein